MESNLVKLYPAVDFNQIKPGTIIKHRFNDTKIRYIFHDIEPDGAVVLIPIYTKKNDGQKWITNLIKIFTVCEESEQIIKDYSTFDLNAFCEYCKNE